MCAQNVPERPAEARQTRRTFYLSAIYGMGAIITGMLSVPAVMYLFKPAKGRKLSPWVKVGDISQVQPGKPAEMVFQRKRVDGWKIITEKTSTWVVKEPNNQVVAYSPQCTHLGCAYHWDDSQHVFICPCHNSAFSIDGRVLTGPAPRPLDRLQVKLEGTQLEVGPLERHA